MTEQVDLAVNHRPKPPRHALRRGIFAIDAVDDLFDLETRKRPVDRRSRRLDRITLAAKFAGYPPADLKPRPAPGPPPPPPSCEFAGALFLDPKHADAVQHPMPGHDRCVPPADKRIGD